jgi:hypothetical protein
MGTIQKMNNVIERAEPVCFLLSSLENFLPFDTVCISLIMMKFQRLYILYKRITKLKSQYSSIFISQLSSIYKIYWHSFISEYNYLLLTNLFFLS